jgi:[acyl-carrier-protein] S-malonyltransferase
MQSAEDRLTPHIEQVSIKESSIGLVMNVTGAAVQQIPQIRTNLIKQVTHPVRWEQGIRFLMQQNIDLFIEIGCGKALAGFNKRIGTLVPTLSIEKVDDLRTLESLVNS